MWTISHGTPALMVSSVAQGKKPATSATTTLTPSRKTPASHQPNSTISSKPTPGRIDSQPTRQLQKRVLPSRSRRGGPGLGTADVDSIILDAQKRKCELVPSYSNLLRGSVPVRGGMRDRHRPAEYTRFVCSVASGVFTRLPR